MDKGYSLEHPCGAAGSVLALVPGLSLPPMQLVPELATFPAHQMSMSRYRGYEHKPGLTQARL